LLALFVGLCIVRALDDSYPFYDDVAYLDLGYQIRAAGGPLQILRQLFAGTFLESNRHPLYAMLLSLVAGRDLGYHRRAQALSIALGAVMILSFWQVTRRLFGARPALWLAGFLCVSETAVAYSSKEACEPLMMIFWAFGLLAIADGAPDRAQRSNGWIVAGALSGLAFLTKGNGIFLLFSLGVAALLHEGWRALRDARLYGSVLAFTAVASPLLVRNLRAFGSPLYNWNSQLLWIDHLHDFSELAAPHALDRIPHTPREYFAQLTFAGLARRLGVGMGKTLAHAGDAMSLVAPVPWGAVHIALVVLGVGAAGYGVFLVWGMQKGFLRTFLLVQAAWFYAFFVFYDAVSASSRYLFPMTVTLAMVIAARLGELEHPLRARWPRAVLVFAGAAVMVTLALDPSPRRPPDGFLDTERWVLNHLEPGEAVAVDSRSRLQPLWLLPPGRGYTAVATTWQGQPVPDPELLSWLREQHVRYLVVDGDSNLEGRPRWFFFERLSRLPDGSLAEGPLPDGVRLAYAGNERPRRWEVLELAPR
jgi:4-amino-4-deoxy-L-arabinose transferase-like glycosyltransferase